MGITVSGKSDFPKCCIKLVVTHNHQQHPSWSPFCRTFLLYNISQTERNASVTSPLKIKTKFKWTMHSSTVLFYIMPLQCYRTQTFDLLQKISPGEQKLLFFKEIVLTLKMFNFILYYFHWLWWKEVIQPSMQPSMIYSIQLPTLCPGVRLPTARLNFLHSLDAGDSQGGKPAIFSH